MKKAHIGNFKTVSNLYETWIWVENTHTMTDSFLWLAPAGQFDNVTFQQSSHNLPVSHTSCCPHQKQVAPEDI